MDQLKRWLATMLLVVGFSSFGLLKPAVSAEYPQVSNLAPFVAESNYMSLSGYLRFLVYEQTGTWMSRDEATRVVAQQQNSGG